MPSFRRACCTTRSSAPATCSRMARTGRSTPAISTMVSRRASESRGLLAWTVVIEPSWPVFMACSMSSAAPSRTSPTTMRSGRIRSEFLTSSRMSIWPRPSMFDGRDSRRSTWSWCSWSSAASSIVMMRSLSGMKDEMTLSVVVLPEPVPPEMTMLRRPSTQALRKSRTAGEKVPKAIRSASLKRVLGELADREHRAVERDRRDDGVDAGAVGEPGVDQRAAPRRRGGRPARRSCR